jgi:hypothetical protein
MLEAIVSGNSLNNSLNNSFNKKVSNKSTIYTCQYWKCFRSSYFSHLHLHRRVHFNFALAPRAGTCASALHIQLEYIPGEGLRDPNGKQLAILFLPSMISGVVDGHHGHLSCCPDACLEDTPFEMLIQSITRWGNSLHVPNLL